MDCGHEVKILKNVIDPIYSTLCESCIKSHKNLSDSLKKSDSIDFSAWEKVVTCARSIIKFADAEKGNGDDILLIEMPKACHMLEKVLDLMDDQINRGENYINVQHFLETTKKITISLAHILLLIDDNKCRFFASRCVQAAAFTKICFTDGKFDENFFNELNKLMLEIICDAETRQKDLTSVNQAAKISRILSCLIQLVKNLTDYSESPQINETSHSHIEFICKKIVENLQNLALSYKQRNYYNDHCPYNSAILSKCEQKMKEIFFINENDIHKMTCPEIMENLKYIISTSIFMSSECRDKELKDSILNLCLEIISSSSYQSLRGQNEFISLESLKWMYYLVSQLRTLLDKLACQNLAEVIYKAAYQVEAIPEYFNKSMEEWNEKVKDLMVFNRSLLNSFYFVAITSCNKDAALRLMRSVTSMEDIMEKIIQSQTESQLNVEIKNWSNQFSYCMTLTIDVIDLSLFMKISAIKMENIVNAISSDEKKQPYYLIGLNSDAYTRVSSYIGLFEKYELLRCNGNSKLTEIRSSISSLLSRYYEIINEMMTKKSADQLDTAIYQLREITSLMIQISDLISCQD